MYMYVHTYPGITSYFANKAWAVQTNDKHQMSYPSLGTIPARCPTKRAFEVHNLHYDMVYYQHGEGAKEARHDGQYLLTP